MLANHNRWVALGVLCLAELLVMIDNTIVNVALPTISRDLSASTTGLQWVVDAYTLAFAGLLLAGGYLGDRYGRRRALVIGVAAFGGVSAIAASATSLGELIAARAALGVFASLVFPATLALLTNLFTNAKERAAAVGIWGATSGVAVAVGPVLGGALLEHFSWSSVFWVNVPFAIVVIAAVLIAVPADRGGHTAPFDALGVLLSIAGVSLLVYTVIEGPHRGWWTTPSVLGFVGAAIVLAAFVVRELRIPHPILDVRLFTNRLFAASSGMIAIAFFSLFGFIFLITQYMQAVKGYDPLEAGIRTLPFAIVVAVVSPLAIIAARLIGPGITVGIGSALMSSGFAVALTADRGTSYWALIFPAMCLMAAGLALIQGPATSIIMDSLEPHQAGAGSAVNDTTREIGGTLGVAVLGSILASLYGTQVDSRLAGVGLPADAEHAARTSVMAGVEVAQRVPGQAGTFVLNAVQDAFVDGLHRALWAAIIVTAMGAPTAWALLRTRRQPTITELPADERELVDA